MEFDIKEFLAYYLVFIGGGIAILLTLFHMLYTRRSPTSMIVWFLLMVIAPYIFIFLYLFFGTRKNSFNERKSSLNRYDHLHDEPFAYCSGKILQSHQISQLTHNNNLTIHTDSNTVYQHFIQALKDAQQSIKISTYVFKYDDTTKEILKILEEKLDNGVEVEILVDTVGSYKIYLFRHPLRKLKKYGAKVHFFSPPFKLDFFTKFNLRYHRKIYIIDEEILFSGGMNLSNEYMGNKKENNCWIDLMFEVKGDLVQNYVEVFNYDIAYVTNTDPKPLKPLKSEFIGNQELQLVPSGPDVRGDVLHEIILNAIYNAKERIWIITPYFIPDESILQAIKIAAHKGINVKLITPLKSNHLMADLTRSSYIRQLQDDNIEIVLYEGKMIHAKAILFDDEEVLLGSSNLDYRSLLLNYEVVTISYAKEHIQMVKRWMDSLSSKGASKLAPAGKIRRTFENSMRIFASQL